MSSSLLLHAAPTAAGATVVASKCHRNYTSPLLRKQGPAAHGFRPFTNAKPQARQHNSQTALQAVGRQQFVAIAELPDAVNAEEYKLPPGYEWYETMMILRSTLSDEERDKECAKFEVFLAKHEALEVRGLTRGRSRMAYPIRQNWEGAYVLYNYAAKRATAKAVQNLLANPDVGSEDTILRWMQFRKSGR